MKAQPGDELTVRGRHQGDGDRHGTILRVAGENGEPPFVVRWGDGRESVLFPAADTQVTHHSAQDTPN